MIVSKSELQQFYDEHIAGHPTEHFRLGAELYHDLSSKNNRLQRGESNQNTVRLEQLAEKHKLPIATVRDALDLRKFLWKYDSMRTDFLKRNPLSQEVNRMPTADSILLRGSVEHGVPPKLLGDVTPSEYASVYEEERSYRTKMQSFGIASSQGKSHKAKPVQNVSLSRYMTPKQSTNIRPEVKDRMSDYRTINGVVNNHSLEDDGVNFDK